VSSNPVARRLDDLRAEWVDFTKKSEARVLCWLVEPDEYSMVDALLVAENDARAGKLSDVFVALSSPFVSGKYGDGLLKEFVEKAEALHAGLEDDSVARWQPPAPPANGFEGAALWKACGSFVDFYKLPRLLALVLTPSKVDDMAAFRQWLDNAARSALPGLPKLRLVALDDVRAPSLAELARALPERAVAVPAELDMGRARLEVSEEAGGLGTPGGQFRHQFVQMTNALGERDLATAEKHSQAALAITNAQGWHALAVPIHLAMGASLAGAGQLEPAGKRYLEAEAAAAAGENAGDATCPKLRVQARLCRGSLLILQSAWKPAATLFTETRPMAEALKEPGMVVDCYRLASFSLEQDKQFPPAWQSGVDGVAYAKTQEKETLGSTTLSYLGLGLSRIGKQKEYISSWRRVESDLVALVGPDWRPAEPPPEQAPAAAPKGGGRS